MTLTAGIVAYNPTGILFKLEVGWSDEANFDLGSLSQLAGHLLSTHPTTTNLSVSVRETAPSGQFLRGWGHHAWNHRVAWGYQPHPPIQRKNDHA